MGRKVDFVGIGAQKSATSWIAKCLSAHPEVFVADCKETHFFSDDQQYTQGIDYYHNYFSNTNDASAIGEYSTSYLTSPTAAERLQLYTPSMRLIVCLRNPIDRAFSHYLHLKYKTHKNGDCLQTLIRTQPQIIENGMYGKSLRYYFKLFPADNILVLFYEDIRESPQNFIKQIYRFIGVDTHFTPAFLNRPYNTSDARSSNYFRKINKLYFILNQYVVGQKVISSLRHLGLNALVIDSVLRRTSNHKEQISKGDRKVIYQIYQEDINELSCLLGMDLSHWEYQ